MGCLALASLVAREQEGGFAADRSGDSSAVALDEVCGIITPHGLQHTSNHKCLACQALWVASGQLLLMVDKKWSIAHSKLLLCAVEEENLLQNLSYRTQHQ